MLVPLLVALDGLAVADAAWSWWSGRRARRDAPARAVRGPLRLSEHVDASKGDRLSNAPDGQIPARWMPNALATAALLESIRAEIGPFRVTSLYRTPAGNAAAGGAAGSAHLEARAGDFVPARMPIDEAMVRLAAAQRAGRLRALDRLIIGPPSANHLHASIPRPGAPALGLLFEEPEPGVFVPWRS